VRRQRRAEPYALLRCGPSDVRAPAAAAPICTSRCGQPRRAERSAGPDSDAPLRRRAYALLRSICTRRCGAWPHSYVSLRPGRATVRRAAAPGTHPYALLRSWPSPATGRRGVGAAFWPSNPQAEHEPCSSRFLSDLNPRRSAYGFASCPIALEAEPHARGPDTGADRRSAYESPQARGARARSAASAPAHPRPSARRSAYGSPQRGVGRRSHMRRGFPCTRPTVRAPAGAP